MKKSKVKNTIFSISPENLSFVKEFQRLSGMNEEQVFDFLIFVAKQEIDPLMHDMEEIKKDNPHLDYAAPMDAIDEKYENCPCCNPAPVSKTVN